MGAQKVVLSLTILLTLIGANKVLAQCGTCMANMGYCIDEKNFYICPNGAGGKPLTSSMNSCSADEVCTSAEGICVKRDEAPANAIVCGNNCAQCPASTEIHKSFTCVSATQYALCTNEVVTNIVGTCNAGEFCNVEHYIKHGSMCVPECVLSFYDYKQTCLNQVATTTVAPTVSTPAPDIADLKQQCADNKPPNLHAGGYYNVKNKNDPNCKSFIYCEDNDGLMVAILMNCKSKFYDSVTKKCVEEKPASCTVPQPESPTEATTTEKQAEEPQQPAETPSSGENPNLIDTPELETSSEAVIQEPGTSE